MTVISHRFEASCPPSALWSLLSDLEAVQRYNPTVRTAKALEPGHTGVGAMRVCELEPKGRVVERVTAWEEGTAVGFEVVESDWPIHFMRWTTRVSPHEGGSVVTQDLEYQVKFGPLGWLLDNLVMRRKLRSTLDEVLGAFVHHGEGRA
jgi:Polyketide cyclase / dehydrase and lipid transport